MNNNEVVPLCAELRIVVAEIIENVCMKCKYYNKRLGVCRGEVLPVEAAILRNAAGRGLCDDVKDFVIAKGRKKVEE